MKYTTFIRDEEKRPSELQLFERYLNWARAADGQVYIVGIRSGNGTTPDIIQKLREIQGVSTAMHVIDTVQLIIPGAEGQAMNIANNVHEMTGYKIGIVKDDGRRNVAISYQKLHEALDIAQKSNKPWHLYDPAVDSIEAILAKAREK